MLGHNYTCWLKFKGGKGIATTAGVYLALAPWALLVALVVFILAVLMTRYVSVGSIAAAMALPCRVWIMPPHNLFLGIVTTALGALAIYKHKSNIQRLMAGTENRLGKKSGGNEMKITVLGAGAWGTALAKVLQENGNAVTLWDIDAGTARGNPSAGATSDICPACSCRRTGRRSRIFKRPSADAECVVMAIPSQSFRAGRREIERSSGNFCQRHEGHRI